MLCPVNGNFEIIRSRIGKDASPFIGLFIDCVLGFIFCVQYIDVKLGALLLSSAADNRKMKGGK